MGPIKRIGPNSMRLTRMFFIGYRAKLPGNQGARGKCFAPWNLLAPHTRLSNVPDLERSAVLLQRHVVFCRAQWRRALGSANQLRGCAWTCENESRGAARTCSVHRRSLHVTSYIETKTQQSCQIHFFAGVIKLIWNHSHSLRVWHLAYKAN